MHKPARYLRYQRRGILPITVAFEGYSGKSLRCSMEIALAVAVDALRLAVVVEALRRDFDQADYTDRLSLLSAR